MEGTEIKVECGHDIEGQKIHGHDRAGPEEENGKQEEWVSQVAVKAAGH